MGNVFRLETARYHRDENGPFYDGTKNGVILFYRLRYSEAYERIAWCIEDDDIYQEVFDGVINCETTGAHMKKL